jgi:NAD(P)-dependent dehydrogenase (short-subunit alcohol dehydrogenase family)
VVPASSAAASLRESTTIKSTGEEKRTLSAAGAASDRTIALVTGAAQGIGLGIARSLALTSYKVVLADIEDQLLGRSVGELRGNGFEAVGEHLDVTSSSDWARVVSVLIARWGGLDLLVNCAGISPRGTVETTDEALWDRTMAINLKGAWLGVKAAIPHLRQRGGTIINIGSTRATRPMPGLFSYIVSKAGLWGLTQQVAAEYLTEGITCNMIAPGWVDTPNERLIQAQFGRPDFPAGIRNLTTPEEIGASVVYLASPPGRRINGVILYLDSGLQIADDAGMVYLTDRCRPPYEQRI